MTPEPASHFSTLEQQRHAARLGMWTFLASEVLLFAALFTLVAAYRVHDPAPFALVLRHAKKTLGSINTGILLTSSAFAASAVHSAREGRRGGTVLRLGATGVLGLGFLAIKLTEYAQHLHEGYDPTRSPAWGLYWLMTGLHGLHVAAGVIIIATLAVAVLRRAALGPMGHRVEVAALYWHLVDLVWIFLWPLFYLA